jgi:1-acyl-sn-glycerol-3-phosphate acyltransferase
MLDIGRLERIRLSRHPLMQRFVGHLLLVNREWLPGFETEVEHAERLPREPVIFAMNHTDRYNYFPFQVWLWRSLRRFTAVWVKGKYYEHWFVANFMEKTNQLPTISRGYIISKDFAAAVGRVPTDAEYEAMRHWVDAVSSRRGGDARPAPDVLPEPLLSQPRNVLGLRFDPDKQDWASYVDTTFRTMMQRFVELNEQAARVGLDILIFPQGTRSKRLLPGHVGISQIALHLRLPIVPVGCNGSDGLYPSASPWAKRGRVVYRIGEPIDYDSIAHLHVAERFAPFTPDAEEKHREKFEALAALVTERIDGLLDEPYRLAPDAGRDATRGVDRFLA